jgi:hypothetical protein
MHEYYCVKLRSSPNIKVTKSRTIWAGHMARIEEVEFILHFVGKTDGKRPPRRPTQKWEDNIKVYIQDAECERAGWIHLAQRSD